MNATDLIAEFAQRSRLPSLSLSDEGTARIVIDETLEIDLEHDDVQRQLHLYTSLGQPPLEEREAFYARALAANLFGRATGGATLALDALRGDVLLVRSVDIDTTDITALEAALQSLVDARERLSVELLGVAPRETPEATARMDFASTVMMRA